MALTRLVTMWKVGLLNSLIVLGIACFLITGADCKRSACWRYGHVCWGGHGKRSGQPPLAPLSGSMETDVEDSLSGSYPSHPSHWNLPELNRLLKIQLQPAPFLTNGIPPAKMQQLSPTLLMLQPRLHHGLRQYQQINPFSQTSKQIVERQGVPSRIGFPEMAHDENSSDDLVISGGGDQTLENEDDVMTNARSYSSAFKRNGHEFRGKTGTGTRGTEEPLVTSANGQDASGTVAMFFRDRKSIGKPITENMENDGFSNVIASSHDHPAGKQGNVSEKSRRLRSSNIYEVLPLAQYSIARGGGDTLPKTIFNY